MTFIVIAQAAHSAARPRQIAQVIRQKRLPHTTKYMPITKCMTANTISGAEVRDDSEAKGR